MLLTALVLAPWVYGSVEDSVRYALCAVLLVAAALFGWPDLRDGKIPRGALIALAFPAFALVQIGLRQTVAPILSVEAAMVGFAMAMVWAAVDGRAGSTSTNSGRRLAAAFLLACASETAFAAFQWSADRTALFGQHGGLQTMPFGSYVNHNNFAGLVSLGVPLAIAIAIGDLRRSGKLTPLGLGLMGLACGLSISVFASGSRGGAVALVSGLIVLAWISAGLQKKTNARRGWFYAGVAGSAVLGFALSVIPDATRVRLFKLAGEDGSSAYRMDIGLAAVRAFAARPILGSGLGAFGDAAAPFKQGHGDVRSERAEADLVEFATEGGVILLAALIVFGRFAWSTSHREMAESRDRSGRWLRAGALAACATMLVHSLFDFGFRIPANTLAFAVLLGIATATSRSAASVRPAQTRVLILFLGVATAGCVYRSLGAAGERAALGRATPESRLDALQPLVDAHPYLDAARRERGLAWLALAYSHGQYAPARLSRARQDLEIVVASRRQWGVARADLAWIKYFQGQIADSRREMDEAARLDPTHVGVGIASAQLSAWSGDLQAALERVSSLRRANPAWSRASARELVASWTKNPAVLENVP